MKNHPLIIAIAGLAAAFFAVVLNLVTNTNPDDAHTLAIEATIAAIIALVCGVVTFRKGGGWRFLAIAMIGPAVFVLTDAGMRLLLFAQQGA